MDNRRNDKRPDVGGDEIEKHAKLGKHLDILLQTQKKYHELTQEQTKQSDQQIEKKSGFPFVDDRLTSGKTGDEGEPKGQYRIAQKITKDCLRCFSHAFSFEAEGASSQPPLLDLPRSRWQK
jgi:hypothetical protein